MDTISLITRPNQICRDDKNIYTLCSNNDGSVNNLAIINLQTNAVSYVTASRLPQNMIQDENYIYIENTNSGTNDVTRVSKADKSCVNIPTIASAIFMAIDNTNLYIGSRQQVIAVNKQTFQITTLLSGGYNSTTNQKTEINAINQDNHYVYIAVRVTSGDLLNSDSTSIIYRFSKDTLKLEVLFAISNAETDGAFYSSFNKIAIDDNFVYISDYGGAVFFINKVSGEFKEIPIGATTPPTEMYSDINNLYVISGSDVIVISKQSSSIIKSIAVGEYPLRISGNDSNVYVTNSGSNNVSVINKTTMTASTISTGTYPIGVCADNNYVCISNCESNTVSKITIEPIVSTSNGYTYVIYF